MLYALLVILQTNQCYITMGYSCPLLRGTFLERPSYLFLTIRRCTKVCLLQVFMLMLFDVYIFIRIEMAKRIL